MLLRNQKDAEKSEESKINKVEEKADKSSLVSQYKFGLYKKEKDASKASIEIQYAKELKVIRNLSKISDIADYAAICFLGGAWVEAYVYQADFSVSLLMCGSGLMCAMAGRLLDFVSEFKRGQCIGKIIRDNYFFQLETILGCES